MSKPTSKYPKGKSLVDVTTKYNFVDVSYNYTPWSDFIESSKINTKEDKTYKVLLPLDLKKLPKVSEAANILSWEVEEKEYYKYRDKKWKWYINQNSEYSGFSSEQPSGYANKDRKTEIQAEQTEWSTNYPEEKSYRKISTQTGYKFYYEDEDGNLYCENGNYNIGDVNLMYCTKDFGEPLGNVKDIERYELINNPKDDPNYLRRKSHQYEYMMLSRLESDCKYFLGNGNGFLGHLYYRDIDKHIAEMKKIYEAFLDQDKPKWISLSDIEKYKEKMEEYGLEII